MKKESDYPDSLFVYGTLLFDSVWDLVVGSAVERQAAKLNGWSRFYMHNKVYPGIKAVPNAEVEGLLIHGLSRQDVWALDKFEDPVYTKRNLEITTLTDSKVIPAYAYVIEGKSKNYLSNKPWEPAEFECSQLELFLKKLRKHV